MYISTRKLRKYQNHPLETNYLVFANHRTYTIPTYSATHTTPQHIFSLLIVFVCCFHFPRSRSFTIEIFRFTFIMWARRRRRLFSCLFFAIQQRWQRPKYLFNFSAVRWIHDWQKKNKWKVDLKYFLLTQKLWEKN